MADYIDREAVCYQLEKQATVDGQPRAIRRARRIVAEFPAADVRPVVHARWERVSPDDHYDFRCVCSHCRQHLIESDEQYDFKYCPNCGADMGEEQDE